jgi:hypothetical protein
MNGLKKAISIVLILMTSLVCLSGCRSAYAPSMSQYTDCEGVYIMIDEIEADGFGETLTVSWHNETDYTVTFGLDYTIELYKNNEWVDIQMMDFGIPEVACILSPHSTMTQKYITKYFNTFAEGDYRIRVKFYIDNAPDYTIGESYAPFAKGYK